ncbi:hypothetical protein CHS0354_000680 [Potamilus streckersoni]|uniref:PpiC domain-containing protein n=1 Tax=Potamilus streckersoni TaxID=2493646 RepID=A0AAE0T706_9BIVA|nr:hypothetical protein CHS0354_000680 [Potamilus streckersoni]
MGFGCEWKIKTSKNIVVAKVKDDELTADELYFAIGRNFSKSEDSVTKASIYIEDWKRRISLYRAGLKEGLDKDSEVVFLINKITQKIIAERYLEKQLEAKSANIQKVDSSEVRRYYIERRDIFTFDDEAFRVQRVFVENERQAKLIIKQTIDQNHLETILDTTKFSFEIRERNIRERVNKARFRNIKDLQLGEDKEKEKKELSSLRINSFTSPTKLMDSTYGFMYLLEKKPAKTIMPFEDAYEMVKSSIIADRKERAYIQIISEILKKQTEILEKIVAVIGEEIVLKSEIDGRRQFFAYQNQLDATSEDLWNKMLDATIDEKLILAKAILDSIDVNETGIDMEAKQRFNYLTSKLGSEKSVEDYFGKSSNSIMYDIKTQVKNQQLISSMQQKVTSKVSVSNKDVNAFYTQYKDSLPDLPLQVELSRIVIFPSVDSASKIESINKIREIKRKLDSGEEFEKLAREFSDDEGSAKHEGDLGFIKRGEFVKNFEAEVFKLRENEVSGIIETEFGLHIIKLVERRGEKVRAKHILARFDQSKIDEESVVQKLNKLRRAILNGEISFGLAAREYSQDEESAQRGGDMVDANTYSLRLNYNDLQTEIKQVVDSLKVGEISSPHKVYFSQKEAYAFQILLLKEKTIPHKMNLEQDYTLIQNFALQQMKQMHLRQWIEKLKSEIYWVKK